MGRNQFLVRALIGLFVLVATTPAWAVWWASEPTQIANNVELVMNDASQVVQEMRQNLQYALQGKQYYEQVRQGQFLDTALHAAQLAGYQKSVDDLNNAINAVEGLQGALGDFKSLEQSNFQQFAASGLSWQQYLNRQREINRLNKSSSEYLSTQEVQAIKRTQNTWVTVQKYSQELPESASMHETMNKLSGQMNVLIQLMNDQMQMEAQRSTDRLRKEQMVEQAKLGDSEESNNQLSAAESEMAIARRRARALVPKVQ